MKLPPHVDKAAALFSNGELLRVAEEAGIDVFVTADTHLADQQNLGERQLAIVVLSRNRRKSIEAKIGSDVPAVNNATPGSYTLVDI